MQLNFKKKVMDNTIYKGFKELLKVCADTTVTDDKPMRRQCLNDYTDHLRRKLEQERLRERISDKQYNLYCEWLTSYCIKRHDK